jgi:putative flippase GtrA
MARVGFLKREGVLGAKYAGVSLTGFGVDAVLLHLLMAASLEPAWARVVSLVCAMQVTFALNGRHVFRRLERASLPRQWWRYMLSNGFGNFCNYWIFVTLVSLHWRVVSLPIVAMSVGAFTAWVMNYAATRFWVFARGRGRVSPSPSDGVNSVP